MPLLPFSEEFRGGFRQRVLRNERLNVDLLEGLIFLNPISIAGVTSNNINSNFLITM